MSSSYSFITENDVHCSHELEKSQLKYSLLTAILALAARPNKKFLRLGTSQKVSAFSTPTAVRHVVVFFPALVKKKKYSVEDFV